jgi:flagellar hook-basal body complex protein FliE
MKIDPGTQTLMRQTLRGTDLEGLYGKSRINPGDGTGIDNPIDKFAGMLEAKVGEVNEVMQVSDQKIEAFARGDERSIHDVMVAMSKADISFKLMTQVGRKVIEAYQEIMRMQV